MKYIISAALLIAAAATAAYIYSGKKIQSAEWRIRDEEPHQETFRERVTREHPEVVCDEACGGVMRCPCDYGYERDICSYSGAPRPMEVACRECWDREIPEEDDHEGVEL